MLCQGPTCPTQAKAMAAGAYVRSSYGSREVAVVVDRALRTHCCSRYHGDKLRVRLEVVVATVTIAKVARCFCAD